MVTTNSLTRNIFTQALEMQAHGELLAEAHDKVSLQKYLQLSDGKGAGSIFRQFFDIRQILLCARLNNPTFVEFVTVEGNRLSRCKLCQTPVDTAFRWSHIISSCPAV